MTRRGRPTSLASILGAALVAALLAAAVWVSLRPDAEPAGPSSVLGPTSTLPVPVPGDIEAFLAAFEASRTGTYRVDGYLELTEPGIDGLERIDVRIARRGADVVEEWGTTLVVSIEGRQQSCERFDGSLTCGTVTAGPRSSDEVEALRGIVSGETPQYQLFLDSPGCWQLIANESPAPAPWGQTTTICFDTATGAVSRQATNSASGSRTFAANEISSVVTDDDLSPPTE